jgi:ADP-ribosylation factor-like protein 2
MSGMWVGREILNIFLINNRRRIQKKSSHKYFFLFLGGQKSLRSYWRNYFEATEAIIWVVDSVDKMRLGECRSELHDLLKEERLMGSTLLVFANKQDISGACSLQEIRTLLELDSIHKHHWTVMPCSALTGQNLLEGIDWLVNDVAQRLFDPD